MAEPALALIDFCSIAAGTRAGDAMVKRAAITTFRAGTIQPGRYLILITGGVGEVDESYREGLRVGGDAVCDHVFLPDAHESVQTAVGGKRSRPSADTLGVIETSTVPAVVHAADAAVKGAAVHIREIRTGDGLGGKGIVFLDGELADVQAAIALGTGVAAPRGIEVRHSITPAVHPALLREIGETSRFKR